MLSLDAEQRVVSLHERGVAAVNDGRIASGGRLLRAGLRRLGWPPRDGEPGETADPTVAALTARLLISLAPVESQQGRGEAGLALLAAADRLAAPADRGLLAQQRGLLLLLSGRLADGLAAIDEAIPLLSGERDAPVLARTLLNRAMLHHIAGRVRPARADLDRCEEIARRLGMDRVLAKAMHNRGYGDLLAGDIPGALRALDAARAGFTVHAASLLPVIAVDRARVLLAAGLFTDAVAELDTALALFRGQRLTQEYGEAELVRAQAALAAGDVAGARTWARRAERRFHRRGNETWATVAMLTALRAEFPHRRATAAVVARADQLAVRLAELGLANDAEVAALQGARMRIALGRPEAARATLAARPGPRALLETRLLRKLALAEFGRATGDRRLVFTHARAGLEVLREHRNRFGSVDLQTGATALGAELAGIGLAAALEPPVTPARVFDWLERSRAQAFRLYPVRPPLDADTLDAVGELRHLARVAREGELAGRPEPGARRRCAELERLIRARGWQADGSAERHTRAEFAAVAAELAAADTALASYVVHRGELLAVLTVAGRATLHRLGEWPAVVEAVDRLHSDLYALCGRQLRPTLATVIRGSVQRQLGVLAGCLLAPLRSLVGDRDLVVVPTGALCAVPWGLLPDLVGRPVTVAPSATMWLHGRQPCAAARPTRPPLLVAGPDLTHAGQEVTAIASVYPGSTVLAGDAATVRAALPELDGRPVAHIAAHGHHEHDNVLFSRLDLTDGPLMAYDIHQLATAPEHVVLSSCDVGRMVVRTGDEILGFTAALLYGGTRTVVSSVNRVPDDAAASDVMYAYHRALAAGASPARALADAGPAGQLIPFVCFGAG